MMPRRLATSITRSTREFRVIKADQFFLTDKLFLFWKAPNNCGDYLFRNIISHTVKADKQQQTKPFVLEDLSCRSVIAMPLLQMPPTISQSHHFNTKRNVFVACTYFKYGKKISYTAPNRLKLVRLAIVSSDKHGCDFRATQSQSVFIKTIQYAISDYHNEH